MIEQSAEFDKIAIGLVKAQAMVKPAIKDGKNPHFRSEYATLESVWDAVRDALTANSLAVVQFMAQGEPGHCTIVTMLVHVSGQWIRSTGSIPVARRFAKDGRDLGFDAQGYGAAFSYGRRYGLAALLGVISDDDDDGNAASHSPPSAHRGTTPRRADNSNKRAEMCRRIAKLEQEIEIPTDDLRREIIGGTGSLDEASEEKLKEYGIALKNLIPEKEGQE
jgi:hypothetical protein